jgi:hypothetical protein
MLNKLNEDEDMDSVEEKAAGSKKKEKLVEDPNSDLEMSESELSFYFVCS